MTHAVPEHQGSREIRLPPGRAVAHGDLLAPTSPTTT